MWTFAVALLATKWIRRTIWWWELERGPSKEKKTTVLVIRHDIISLVHANKIELENYVYNLAVDISLPEKELFDNFGIQIAGTVFSLI